MLQRAVVGLPAAEQRPGSALRSGASTPRSAAAGPTAALVQPLNQFCTRGTVASSAIAGPADLSRLRPAAADMAAGPAASSAAAAAAAAAAAGQQAALTTSLPAWVVHDESGGMSAGIRRMAAQLAVPAYGLCMAPGAESCETLQELAEAYLQVGPGWWW
jgi:hypothetical protein